MWMLRKQSDRASPLSCRLFSLSDAISARRQTPSLRHRFAPLQCLVRPTLAFFAAIFRALEQGPFHTACLSSSFCAVCFSVGPFNRSIQGQALSPINEVTGPLLRSQYSSKASYILQIFIGRFVLNMRHTDNGGISIIQHCRAD